MKWSLSLMPEALRSIKDQSITRTARSFGLLIPMETRSNSGSQNFGTTRIRNDNEDSCVSTKLPLNLSSLSLAQILCGSAALRLCVYERHPIFCGLKGRL